MKKRLLSLALCLALCLGLFPFGALATGGGGFYVPPGSPTEGGGGTYTPPEDTRAEIWCVGKPSSIQRGYDGTTDGSTIPIDLTFTDGTDTFTLKERTGFTAKKTFDSADAGRRTVTVEIELIGDAAAKYKLKAGGETFTIGGYIDKAYPDLTVSLSRATCAVGEKLLPLLSVDGVQEGAAVTYYYTPIKSGYLEFEGSNAVPEIDENTAISEPGTYYVYAKTGETKNYEEERSTTVELTVSNDVASVTTSDGVTNNYTSLDDALDAAENGDTVTLLSDVDLGQAYVTINKSITFDLGGKTLSSSKAWLDYGVLLIKNATVTVKNGTVKATGSSSCAIRAYGSGASMTLEDVTATVTSDASSVMVGNFGSTVIKSGDYQGLYVGAESQVTLEGGTFRPYMDTITTNENVKSIFWQVNETTDTTSRDCMELLGDGCVYVDETRTQVRTGGGFNTVVTVQQGTAIDAPVAKIGDVEYASLSKAINAVQNGGTITLLNDLDLGNGAVLQVGSPRKNFTIDLASHTLRADGDCLIMLHNGSQLTLKNGTLDGSRCTSYEGVLYISSNSGPKLTLENVTAKNVQRSVPLVYVTNGTVEFDGGTYTGGVLLKTDGNAVLKSGTFQKGTNDYSIKTEDSGKHLSDYLDEGSLSWKDNERLDLSSITETADTVTVLPCNHNWQDGKCTVCQKVCDHGSADGKSMTKDPCPTCGMKAAAQVDITGSATKYFPSFTDALSYATQNSGCTLKLLADVVDVTVNTDKSFIFDLNGYKVYSLNVNSRITLKDSSGGNGKITEWLKVPSGMKVGELLEDGYALRKLDGTWASETDQAVGGVSILPVPIRSVTAANPSVTVEYGKTADVTLRATVVPSAEEDETVSCQWYTGGGTRSPIEGATDSTYQLPANLNAGEHTFYLFATKDGYEKSCEFTVTVEKVNLRNAEIAFPYGNVLPVNPVGATGVPTFTVTCNGKEVEKDALIITGDKFDDVGTCTLTVTAAENSNYTGSKSAEWTVRPLKIKLSSGTIEKTYDGTTDLPANAKITFESAENMYAGQTIRLGKGTDYQLDTSYDSPDAGEEKTVSGIVKLLCKDFVFDDGTEAGTSEKGFTLTGKINKATIDLNSIRLEQYVFNDLEKTYEIELKTLLPGLSVFCEYGEITYGTPRVTFTDTAYQGGDATLTNGVLRLPIASANTSKSEIGTVTIEVNSTNYQTFELTLHVIADDKIVLDQTDVAVSASEITYGQTLADSKLTVTGKMKCPRTGNEIPGTFAWKDGTVIPDAGSYEAEWTFTPDEGYEEYAPATGTATVKVDKAQQYGKISMAGYSYGGTPSTPTLTDRTGDPNAQVIYNYSAVGIDSVQTWDIQNPPALNAGTYRMFARIGATNNYYEYSAESCVFVVAKATPPYTKPTGLTAKYGQTLADVTLPDGWSWMDSSESVGNASTAAKKFKAKFTPADTTNYNTVEDIELGVTVNKANQAALTIQGADSVLYGQTLTLTASGGSGSGAVTYHIGEGNTGEATIDPETGVLTPVKVGSVSVIATKAGGNDYNDVTSALFVLMIKPATPTGAPKYTEITTGGKTLKDAALTTEGSTFSVPGHVQWVEEKEGQLVEMDVYTEVKANTAYTWKFMPDDKENYNSLTGTITLWHKSSSSGSSGSVTPETKTDTVKNPDGSTTKTETKADGSKTETTTASSGGGSTGTTVTKTDAKGNTTTEASAKLSDRDVKEAQEKGKAVTVPVKEIEATKDANAAAKIKIDVPNNADKTTVEIPVENVTSGTVAVIVHEDGTEELVKDSKPTEGGVQLELSGSTTVKILDNSKTFDDTKDHWSRDEVNFVAARELFNGVGGNQFGVSQPMTRGMVNTVLARLAGVDTTPSQGQAWYEVGTDWAKKNGISDGTDPTAPVTREQLATLLYRYAGSPSVSGTLHAADAASVSDYAKDALLWANQNGIVNGVGSNTIAPKDNAQRAQVAAMLARYLQNQ